MIRFICFLLGKSYEPCKGCETLRAQLTISNEDRERLTNTLLEILKPKVVEAAPIELNQIQQSSALFSRRRAALEERDRQEAKVLSDAKHLGKPDDNIKSISSLEKELGIEEA